MSAGATKHEPNPGGAGSTTPAAATPANATPANALDAIVELSHRFGAAPDFTRAGGGNSSAKVDGVLYIKASGTQLATLTRESLIGLRMPSLLERLDVTEVTGAVTGTGGGSDEVIDAAV